MRNKILFVSWDGPAQNYMESLFFPLLSAAARGAGQVGVYQFTWADEAQAAQTARAAARYGLGYTRSDVMRSPRQLAVPAMIAYGAVRLVGEVDRGGWDTLMPRAIIPAAMCLLAMRARPGLRLVFDADGLMADERVEFAGWRATGLQYRLFRDWEAQAVRRADRVIVRTTHARHILAARAGAGGFEDKIAVIPNAKDEALFRPLDAAQRAAVRAGRGIGADEPWLLYAGSLGPQYHPAAMVRLFELVHQRRADARLTLLSGMEDAAAPHVARLSAAARARVEVTRVVPDEVARLAGAADVGLSLREPSFSQRAVCPIKVAEYLLCGLPVVALAGVGDLDERLGGLSALRLLPDVSEASLERAADWIIEALRERDAQAAAAREAGLREFSLGRCANALREVMWGGAGLCHGQET